MKSIKYFDEWTICIHLYNLSASFIYKTTYSPTFCQTNFTDPDTETPNKRAFYSFYTNTN